MLYQPAKTWDGLNGEEMAEVFSRIGPSLGKSPVAPPREKRKKADTNRKRGVVKMFNTERQFGFIVVKGEPDVYFHISNVSDSADTMYFMRGDRVTFEVGEDSRGRTCAKNVRLAR